MVRPMPKAVATFRIDLHMHSIASDGAYTPAQVVEIAQRQAMNVIALTDHDTAAGVPEAIQAAGNTSNITLRVLGGVEMATDYHGGERHILGYFRGAITDTAFLALLEQLRFNRVGRARQMVEKLRALGIAITFEQVQQIAGDAAITRPHVAAALVRVGVVNNSQEAFQRYIGDTSPAYVPHQPITPKAAIEAIHSAGGVAVLAHPGHYSHAPELIAALADDGLDGVEAYYYDHTPPIARDFARLAVKYNLIATVGSDFHRREGDGTARIGSVSAPDPVGIYNALLARLDRQG